MQYFGLRNFQHFVLYLFPTLLFIVVFGIGLSRMHFKQKDAEEKMNKTVHSYPGGIEERNGPFPLVLILILFGTIVWGFLYIIFYGVLEVRV
ncbi:MAG: cbb3-type cytochrome c oxidase N-terminal domain-containing protein [Desulfobacteraceae bacterium]|jgi:hypothetical protein